MINEQERMGVKARIKSFEMRQNFGSRGVLIMPDTSKEDYRQRWKLVTVTNVLAYFYNKF